MDALTRIATKHIHPPKPIKYWMVYDGVFEIDMNNSIALLRHKYKGKNYIFKAIR